MKEYKNVYTDTSYSCGSNSRMKRYVQFKNNGLRNRLLFGSDSFILNLEDKNINDAIVRVKKYIGDDVFNDAAYINPEAFLSRS